MREAERKRLIELLSSDLEGADNPLMYAYEEITERLADYLLDNGVIVLPCKVGDTCYPLDASEREFTCEEKISRITISEKNIIIGYYEHWDYYNHCRKTDNWRLPLRTRILGKGVFLSEAEAKYALKNRRSVSLVNGHIEE